MNKEDFISNSKTLQTTYDLEVAKVQTQIKKLTDSFVSDLTTLKSEYIKDNAIFGVGDIIKAQTNAIMKVDRMTLLHQKFHEDKLIIIYHGLPYKRQDGDFVRTKENKEKMFGEFKTKLLKKAT